MSKEDPGVFRRNVNRVVHPEQQTEEQAKRAPWVLLAFLVALVVIAAGVWALRVFVFEPSQTADPAPVPAATSTAEPSQEPTEQTACKLDNTDRDISSAAPEVSRWVVERWAAIPEVDGAGPCIERDGYRVGFAHTQTGAVLATYHYFVHGIPSSPDAGTYALLEYALLDGALKDSILKDVKAVENGVQPRVPDTDYAGVQLRGYKVVSADDGSAVIELLVANDVSLGSITTKLVWQGDDWRIDPASAAAWATTQKNVSAQGFVPWTPQAAGQ